jgi:hypothetical protein
VASFFSFSSTKACFLVSILLTGVTLFSFGSFLVAQRLSNAKRFNPITDCKPVATFLRSSIVHSFPSSVKLDNDCAAFTSPAAAKVLPINLAEFLRTLIVLAVFPTIPTPGIKVIASNPKLPNALLASPQSRPSRFTSLTNCEIVEPNPNPAATGFPPVGIEAIKALKSPAIAPNCHLSAGVSSPSLKIFLIDAPCVISDRLLITVCLGSEFTPLVVISLNTFPN